MSNLNYCKSCLDTGVHYTQQRQPVNGYATHYDVGDVVRGSGGCRKVRWSRKGTGKSGGVRVIYYNMLEDGTIWLLLIYAKNEHENIPAHILKAVKEEIICP
ncbi:transcriptional regulator [Ferrovum sp.]|uniref:transcriptional regulator n=1 Tax=Ferrovum sp. TaxID=2609467 RepID=UPI003458CCE0